MVLGVGGGHVQRLCNYSCCSYFGVQLVVVFHSGDGESDGDGLGVLEAVYGVCKPSCC